MPKLNSTHFPFTVDIVINYFEFHSWPNFLQQKYITIKRILFLRVFLSIQPHPQVQPHQWIYCSHANQPKYEYSVIAFLLASSLARLWTCVWWGSRGWVASQTVGFRTAMGHPLFTDYHFIFASQETQKSLWTLFFLPKICHFPLNGHLILFSYTRLSYLLFHHWHLTSIERKGSLFRCRITLVEDKGQALVANKSWGPGIKFLTTFWMQCL